MTIEIRTYRTDLEARRATMIGFTSIHQDRISNTEYRVTFVNGVDDPENSANNIQARLKFARLKELREKLRLDTMTDREIREYMRLKDL